MYEQRNHNNRRRAQFNISHVREKRVLINVNIAHLVPGLGNLFEYKNSKKNINSEWGFLLARECMAAFARTHLCPRGRSSTPRGFQPLMWHKGVTSRHGAGLTSRGKIPSFPSPLQIARHGPTFPTLACLAFGWWRWVRLISLPPFYRLARK
jgi:hypothetical protein